MTPDVKVLHDSDLKNRIAVIVGTRPGIVMLAPVIHELMNKNYPHLVIHTGQHYSPNMDGRFFSDLKLPPPHYKLEGVAAKTTHGAQTAVMIEGVEEILLKEKPRLVLVGGDANTNLAGALAARKLRIQVGHIEAGERSYDWRMPEEHNRRLIDHMSEHLFTTGEKGKRQLLGEAVQGKIYITGNPIVDASHRHFELAKGKSDSLTRLQVQPGKYAILTTHREENVDFPDILRNLLEGVSAASLVLDLPILFPVHPRTLKRLKEFDLMEWAMSLPGIRLTEAMGYLDFLNLLARSALVFSDSGGVQQEACIHHVPAVTLRENTEWMETLEIGANRLAGTDPEKIIEAAMEALGSVKDWPVPFGNGTAAKRIVEISMRIVSNGTLHGIEKARHF